MKRAYDEVVADHYRSVAESAGLSSTSTMADVLIRQHETDAIRSFIELATAGNPDAVVADIGCGNGYTLEVMHKAFPKTKLVGIEMSDDLRALAEQRTENAETVQVHAGDIRDPGFARDQKFDVLICQRVLINLLEPEDQKQALDNIIAAVKPGGAVFFIECFTSPLADLNEARDEFELDPIPPAHHNLYLEDDFFEHTELVPFEDANWDYPENYLSTHYYVSRAFEPGLTKGRPFKRNSKAIMFLSQAFPPAVGNFAPLKFCPFRRR